MRLLRNTTGATAGLEAYRDEDQNLCGGGTAALAADNRIGTACGLYRCVVWTDRRDRCVCKELDTTERLN